MPGHSLYEILKKLYLGEISIARAEKEIISLYEGENEQCEVETKNTDEKN